VKVFGVVIVVLGFIVVYIGITGSQHRILNILKGVHLAPQTAGQKATPNAKAKGVSTA